MQSGLWKWRLHAGNDHNSESAPAATKFQIRITDFLYDFYTSVNIKTKLVRYVKVNVQSLPLHGINLHLWVVHEMVVYSSIFCEAGPSS
jgi:hypothetical protein